MKPARLLGRSRAQVVGAIGALERVDADWSRGGGLELRFRGDRCVELRGPVPAAMECGELPAWLGYAEASAPLRRADSCEWPGISLRHRLAPGVVGSYTFADGRFAVSLGGR